VEEKKSVIAGKSSRLPIALACVGAASICLGSLLAILEPMGRSAQTFTFPMWSIGMLLGTLAAIVAVVRRCPLDTWFWMTCLAVLSAFLILASFIAFLLVKI
jgi:hypothetical protein